jgi:carboxyl-terminal processing protease
MVPFSKIRKFILAAAFVILIGGSGYRLGEHHAFSGSWLDAQGASPAAVVNQSVPQKEGNVDFSLFWDVWQRIFRYYIDRTNLNTQIMVYGAISGMVNAVGDPYTMFLQPKENAEFKQDLGGAFDGIGAQLGTKDNHIIVIAPLKESPAAKAGILPGDWIVKVDGEDTLNWTVPTAVSKIRGAKGTPVKLTILHEKDQKTTDITIIRNTISVPSVEFWVKKPADITEIKSLPQFGTLSGNSNSIGYIHLSRFGDNTNDDWEKAIVEIVRQQQILGKTLKGIIFDLRNNPGGYLEGSVYIASEFIKSGTIVSQVNSDGTKQGYPVNRSGRLLDIPLVVLVNKGSASAAEIVSGALKDYKRAKLVGEVTFGKGSVQTPQDLPGGSSVHITTGKWLTPNGETIQKKGITPDVLVPMDTVDASRDAQLEKAIELLLQ